MANYNSTNTGVNIDSTVNQIIDSTTDLNVDSNTLVVDKSTSRVGIGTDNPAVNLDLFASSGDAVQRIMSTSGNTAELQLLETSTDGFKMIYDGAANVMHIQSRYGDVDYPNKGISIKRDDGFVGIGDVSPSHKLTVAGDASFKANYIVNEQGRSNHVANTMSSPYYRFDGVDDIITVTDSPHLDGFTKFSITGSIYLEDSSQHGIVYKYTNAGQRAFSLYLNGNQKLSLVVSSDGTSGEEQVVTTALTVGSWNHFAVTFDNGTFLGYVNGAVSAVNGNFESHTSVHSGSDNMIIGDAQWAGYELQGSLSNLKIWNHELSAPEVKELYSGASVPFKYKGANQTDLVSGWSFSSGWSIYTGTINDADTFTTTGAGGPYHNTLFSNIVGKRYRYHIVGTTSGGNLGFYSGTTGGEMHELTSSGAFDITFEYTHIVGSLGGLYIRRSGAGETTITTFSITQIGAVAEYDGSGMGASRWDDKSGNELHGEVEGATVENAPADADSGLTYEEGTWTPLIGNFTLNSGTLAFTATYIKVGNLVTVSARQTGGNISWNAVTGHLTNLPFPAAVGDNGTFSNHSPTIGGDILLWTNSYIYFYQAGSSQTGLVFSGSYKV